MKYLSLLLLSALLFHTGMADPSSAISSKHTLLHGATLIDLDDEGQSSDDIADACVLFRDGEIVEVGEYSEDLEVPEHTRRVDAAGKNLLSGLVDGFAVINN